MKRYNTYPCGVLVFIGWCLFMVGMSYLSIKSQNFSLFSICFSIWLVSTIFMIKNGFIGSFTVCNKGLNKGDKYYSWEDVCVSMLYPITVTSNVNYFFVFNDRFYKNDEIKLAKKNRFQMLITMNRLKMILKYYNKPITILEESAYGEKVLNAVKEHNKRFGVS